MPKFEVGELAYLIVNRFSRPTPPKIVEIIEISKLRGTKPNTNIQQSYRILVPGTPSPRARGWIILEQSLRKIPKKGENETKNRDRTRPSLGSWDVIESFSGWNPTKEKEYANNKS